MRAQIPLLGSSRAAVATLLLFGAAINGTRAGEAPVPQPAAIAPAAAAPAAAASPSKFDEGAQQLVRGNAGQALADYTEALKDTGLANDRRAAILNERAVAYVRVGQPKLALEDYNRAVQLFAEYPAAYNNRGNLLVALAQPNEAIKDFDRALLLAPGYAAAYSNRANAFIKIGQNAKAIQDFTKAIELMPASAPPLSGRGLAHLATGKPHAAIRDFSRAVNADTRFASAYRNRAEARLSIGQNDEAIEDLSRSAAFDVNNTEIYVVRGYAYLAANNAASAIKDFTRAIELNPKSVAAYQARGLANGLADAFDDAYGDLNRAIELDPRSAVSFAYRAFVYKQNAQPDVGQRDVETAVKLDANAAEVIWARGEIAEARGQIEAAVQDYQKTLSIKPDWRLAGEGLKRLGAVSEVAEEREVAGLGTGKWRVLSRGTSFFATNADYPNLRIALEMIGEGKPKLLAWELKEAPHKGYGILRFSGGTLTGKAGPEDTELAAIIDIENGKVLAIQPHKQGARVASWTWEDDRVQIASVDGVTDEFSVRAAAKVPAPSVTQEPGVAAAAAPKRASQKAPKAASWAPWDQPIGTPKGNQKPQRRASQPSKPKTLFDLLFN
jgi:tetratricopeptide (TPR) repeat protein